jgi:PTS system nitrogen regulatory IIA component
MKLIDLMRKECIVANAKPENKKDALKMVVASAKKNPILKDISQDSLFEALLERERLGSTGFGLAVAIPHCRISSITDFVVGIITVPSGVGFEALDGKDVKLIVYIIAPQEQTNRHIRLLSAVSQTLLIPGVVEEILAQKNEQTILESFLRYTQADIKTEGQTEKSILHILIQEESIFRDIISILASIEPTSLVVINAETAASYLSKMPLFAAFWNHSSRTEAKIIITLVESGLTNEIIRRIESITGNLNERTGIMINVQNVSYSVGSLQA